MKIIHCADLHLDSRMTANLSTVQAKERRNELLDTFRRMIQFAVENQVTAIVIAGDLYDKKNISATARNTVLSAVRDNPQILFFYLKGNHDAESLFGDGDIPPNLFLFGEEGWRTYRIGEEGGVAVTGVELTGQNRYHIFDELVLDQSCMNLVVLHGQLEDRNMGGRKENGKKAPVIPLRALRNKGIDYLALGHIHAGSAGKLDGRGIWAYSGCLEGRGFDECGEHGFILLETDTDYHRFRPVFVPFSGRMLCEAEVDITGCRTSYDALQQVLQWLKSRKIESRSLVRIRLQGETELESEINPEYLTKQLEGDFYYVKVLNETSVRIDYAGFAADASLRGEFVRRVQADPELTEAEKGEIIQQGIRLLTGENPYED